MSAQPARCLTPLAYWLLLLVFIASGRVLPAAESLILAEDGQPRAVIVVPDPAVCRCTGRR